MQESLVRSYLMQLFLTMYFVNTNVLNDQKYNYITNSIMYFIRIRLLYINYQIIIQTVHMLIITSQEYVKGIY